MKTSHVKQIADHVLSRLGHNNQYHENRLWVTMRTNKRSCVRRLDHSTYCVLEFAINGENIHRLKISDFVNETSITYLIDSSLSKEENVLYCEMQKL